MMEWVIIGACFRKMNKSGVCNVHCLPSGRSELLLLPCVEEGREGGGGGFWKQIIINTLYHTLYTVVQQIQLIFTL